MKSETGHPPGLQRWANCTDEQPFGKMKMRISMFDWNGTLLDDVKADEKTFGIKLNHINGGVMGFEVFEIIGTDEAVQNFLDHYELELDDEELAA